MKKKLSTVLLALAAFMPMTAQNLVKGDYGYLYCHIADDYPQYDINPSSEGTGNIIISEHAKILPLKFRDFNKLEL